MYTLGKVILFGDSIIQYSSDQSGFALAPALQNYYARKMDVVIRGFSGYNTSQAIAVLREVLLAENPRPGVVKLVSIFLGTNDAAFNFQGVPLETFKANMQTIVDMVKANGIKLILVGPALHGRQECQKAAKEKALEPNFSTNATNRKYADAVAHVAAANDVPFVDLWKAFQNYGCWNTEDLLSDEVKVEELLPDGIHFSPKAYEIFYEELLRTIELNYTELHVDNIPFYFPIYRDIDYDNIEGSIHHFVQSHTKTA